MGVVELITSSIIEVHIFSIKTLPKVMCYPFKVQNLLYKTLILNIFCSCNSRIFGQLKMKISMMIAISAYLIYGLEAAPSVVINGVETNADTNHPNDHNQYPFQVQYGTVYEPAPSDRGWLAGLIGKKLKDGAKKNLRKTQG